jgi:D-serine deaminase-like pyridoxal phosphate-dependent protein
VTDTEAPISVADKSFPAATYGWSSSTFEAAALSLDEFQTPLLTLDADRIDGNIRVMSHWCSSVGFELAPHGKTTMTPAIWQQQLDAGAWGITLATPWQVQLARRYGVQRILLANALVDPVALRWIAQELDEHPDFDFACWADSVETAELMDSVLADEQGSERVKVVVELGAPGGRTGARSIADALDVAHAIRSSDRLSLVGCGGYEGAVGHDRGVDALARVAGYLDSLVELHRELDDSGAYETNQPIVTVGGSAYLDQVEAKLGRVVSSAVVVIRAGAYVIHDDGFYSRISPLDHTRFDGGLRSAMHAWARVVSRPEPGLAILDAGKRDVPVDEGLPVPQAVVGMAPGASDAVLTGAQITAVNDQHAFLRLADGTPHDVLPVGSVVRLGLSHPCTALDKWRAIPVIATLDDPIVVGFVRTQF